MWFGSDVVSAWENHQTNDDAVVRDACLDHRDDVCSWSCAEAHLPLQVHKHFIVYLPLFDISCSQLT